MMKTWAHEPYEPDAYALSETEARLVLRVEATNVNEVWVHFGDRYQTDLPNRRQMMCSGVSQGMAYYVVDVTIPTHRLKYTFAWEQRDGSTVYLGEYGETAELEPGNVFQLAYLHARDIFHTPEWVRHAVCMEIFPDRYARGRFDSVGEAFAAWDSQPTANSVFGGDIPGITAHLSYLEDLGVNLIYLTPIFASPSNHKYDTEDYFQIDPQFGTKDDLRDLVEQAHRRGIRIVLDAVFNHAGSRFRPFQDVLAHGRQSAYWNWFFIHSDPVVLEPPNYETFANDVASMPKLNTANPEVEAFLLDVAQYWIREFGIDGWRLDVANEVDHVFWRKFRDSVKLIHPEALIIGEVWHNSLPWLRGDQFDGVMNYPLRNLILRFCVDRSIDAAAFADGLVSLVHQVPQPAVQAMFNLLGSHDTPRLLTLAGEDEHRVTLALVLQFTLPGLPMIYYGDEIGMIGEGDPDCRRGMDWEKATQNVRLQSLTKSLARLKQSQRALGSPNLSFVSIAKRAMEFRRHTDTHVIHVALNDGTDPFPLSGVGQVLFASQSDAVVHGRLQAGCALIWRPY